MVVRLTDEKREPARGEEPSCFKMGKADVRREFDRHKLFQIDELSEQMNELLRRLDQKERGGSS